MPQTDFPDGKHLYITQKQHVLTSPVGLDKTNLEPCTHEEADTRIFVHVAHSVAAGNTQQKIRTTDVDVDGLYIGHFLPSVC